MKNLFFTFAVIGMLSTSFISCTNPKDDETAELYKQNSSEDVDRGAIERPGSQNNDGD